MCTAGKHILAALHPTLSFAVYHQTFKDRSTYSVEVVRSRDLSYRQAVVTHPLWQRLLHTLPGETTAQHLLKPLLQSLSGHPILRGTSLLPEQSYRCHCSAFKMDAYTGCRHRNVVCSFMMVLHVTLKQRCMPCQIMTHCSRAAL